jgi:succinyl-diaminopimelate desuccinylase
VSLADDLVWLIDIASPTGHEEALRNAVAARLGATGLLVRQVGRSVVVGEASGKPVVSLYGHLDTVPAQGNLPARIEADRVFGLGASDMKAGLAVMVALLEDPGVQGGPFDVIGVFYDAEEGPADENGLEAVLDAVADLGTSEFAVVMEPTDGELQLGCQGVLNARVEFHGRAAHSARPWLGENAISKAGQWLARMHEAQHRPVEVEGLVFNETYAVTVAEGGVANNVLPSRFVVNLNHRFPPDRTVVEAEARLLEVCAGADEITIVDRAPAAPIPAGSPHLDRLQGLVDVVSAKTAWTDVARLTERGIPAVNYGPGEVAQAHTAGESASVPAMEKAFEVMKKLLTAKS